MTNKNINARLDALEAIVFPQSLPLQIVRYNADGTYSLDGNTMTQAELQQWSKANSDATIVILRRRNDQSATPYGE